LSAAHSQQARSSTQIQCALTHIVIALPDHFTIVYDCIQYWHDACFEVRRHKRKSRNRGKLCSGNRGLANEAARLRIALERFRRKSVPYVPAQNYAPFMTSTILIEQAFNGVQFGMMLFLIGVGVTLVFGTMRVINLAQGSFFMLGGYFLASGLAWSHSYLFAVPAALLAVAILAIVVEVSVLRPLYGRSELDQVLATFGLVLFFNEAVTVIWGRDSIPLSIPPRLTGSVELFQGNHYPVYRLAVTGVAVLTGVALYLFITRTRIGALIRAGSDNREIVAALGVNVHLLYTLVFALSAVLAGLAGIMMGPLLSVEPAAGDPILILTLVVVVIGGLGSVRGALIGALIVGLFDTMSRVLIPIVLQTNATSALIGMAVYVLMAVVLVFRPSGLFSPYRG
jgi:branched-chain amino acid transport system permease protein